MRNLSPLLPSPIQLVEVNFPAAYETATRATETHQQVWMIEGVMEMMVNDERWRLEAGDCLGMRLDCPTVFRNPTRKPARYLVALATLPYPHMRKTG